MIYTIIAILVSSGIVILFKLFKLYNINNLQAITINYAIASLFGFMIYPGEVKTLDLPDQEWFHFAIFIGFSFIAVFNVFALSAQKAGVVITAVFSKMSVIIPVMVGVIIYPDESMNIHKALGVIFILMAFYFIFRNGSDGKRKGLYVILPVVLFLGNGANDSLLNYCENNFFSDNSSLILFLNVIFTSALIIGILLLVYELVFRNIKIRWRNVIAGSLLGLLNFGSTYYVLKALTIMQGSVFFPVFNAGIVIISALAAYFVFREKLRMLNWLGICFATIAICLIALSS